QSRQSQRRPSEFVDVLEQEFDLLSRENAGLKVGPNGGRRPRPFWHESGWIKSPAIETELPYGDEIIADRRRMPFRISIQPTSDRLGQREPRMIGREVVEQAHLSFWPRRREIGLSKF
ncbi:MAG: hypothetical protein ABSF38_21225, partial [Verrucomicrobiota bacterium]